MAIPTGRPLRGTSDRGLAGDGSEEYRNRTRREGREVPAERALADAANQPVLSRPESVLSGRTIEQLAAEAGWRSTHR
jgi:hypothetical protein